MRFTTSMLFALIVSLASGEEIVRRDFGRSLRKKGGKSQQSAYSSIYSVVKEHDAIDYELWERFLRDEASMSIIPSASPVARPTPSPVAAPTKSPVAAPTRAPAVAPITRPTPSPIISPTRSPEAVPTEAPVARPTTSPVVRPTQAPVAAAPTASPVAQPTPSPVVSPTQAPIAAPTEVPATLPPTEAPVPVVSPTVSPTIAPTTTRVTLLELVQTVPELSTLNAAITAADDNRNMPPYLAEVLSSDGPLTVFAPVNSAFDALEEVAPGYVAELLTPDFGLQLFTILSYHATAGIFLSTDFPQELEMLAGGSVAVTGGVPFQVESSSPLTAVQLEPFDVRASNGVAHLVSNVLIPQFVTQNLIDVLAAQGEQFTTLLRLVMAAGFVDELAMAERVALLAPTNAAIPLQTEQFLLQPGNEEILREVLLYHVIDELFNFSAQMVPNILLKPTLQGENIVVGLVLPDGETVMASYNQAVQEDFFLTQDNIAYQIDTILVPPTLSTVVPRRIVDRSEPEIVAVESVTPPRTLQELSNNRIPPYAHMSDSIQEIQEPQGPLA